MLTPGPRRTALLCAALLLSCAAVAAAGTPAKLDSLQAWGDALAAFGFSGQVLVAQGDSLLLSRSCGPAGEHNRPVGYATGFAVGSITKSVTGALVVMLAERGVLSLDEPLARHLPEVPPDKRAITLRQLLSHTSGLPMDAEGVYALDPRKTVLRATLAEPLAAAPGERFLYSNAGFQLLAAVCENATGVPLPHLADSLLFRPLRMRDTGIGTTFARSVRDGADGRNEWKWLPGFRAWRQEWAGSGAGDLVTTARDLWRWARALQGDGPLSRPEIDTLIARRSATGGGAAYGFGLWRPASTGEADVVLIGGDIPGYHARVWFEAHPGGRIVVVVNAGERWGRGLPAAAVQGALWRILLGASVPPPPAAATWPAERLRSLAGEWNVEPEGRLTLTPDGQGLRLEMSGAEGIALAFGADTLEQRSLPEGRAADILRAAAAHDDSALAAALLPVEREAWTAALAAGVARIEKERGPVTQLVIDGTVPQPWLAGGTRTFVRMVTRRGERRVSLGWLRGGLIDVAFDEDRPAPVILPVAPLADGGLAAWDVVEGTLIRIEPFADGKGEPGLRLIGADGHLTYAKRARGHR